MATLVHETAARNAIASAVTALIDANGTGTLHIQTAGNAADLAVLTMSATSFGAPSTGVVTANTITADTNTIAGVAASGQIKDGAGTVILSFDVSTAGASINLSSDQIGAGDTLTITALTYTAAA